MVDLQQAKQGKLSPCSQMLSQLEYGALPIWDEGTRKNKYQHSPLWPAPPSKCPNSLGQIGTVPRSQTLLSRVHSVASDPLYQTSQAKEEVPGDWEDQAGVGCIQWRQGCIQGPKPCLQNLASSPLPFLCLGHTLTEVLSTW